MARSGVRGEGARPRVRQADDLGWDDSLYDENGDPTDGGGASGGRGGDATGKGSGSTTRGSGSSGTGGDSADGRGAGRDGRPVDKDGDDASAEPRGQGRHGGGGGRRRGGGDGAHPRRRRRILRWSASVLALLILGTAGAGYLYYQHLNDNIKKDDLNLATRRTGRPRARRTRPGRPP